MLRMAGRRQRSTAARDELVVFSEPVKWSPIGGLVREKRMGRPDEEVAVVWSEGASAKRRLGSRRV